MGEESRHAGFCAYLLDKDGRIISRAEIAAKSLEDAKSYVFGILRSKNDKFYGIEIWRGQAQLFPTGTPPFDQGADLD